MPPFGKPSWSGPAGRLEDDARPSRCCAPQGSLVSGKVRHQVGYPSGLTARWAWNADSMPQTRTRRKHRDLRLDEWAKVVPNREIRSSPTHRLRLSWID
jgi:hypothetical protein